MSNAKGHRKRNHGRKGHNPDLIPTYGRCDDCGKWRFGSREDARKYFKRKGGKKGRNSAYRCGDYWHFGHPPQRLVEGKISRQILDRNAEKRREQKRIRRERRELARAEDAWDA